MNRSVVVSVGERLCGCSMLPNVQDAFGELYGSFLLDSTAPVGRLKRDSPKFLTHASYRLSHKSKNYCISVTNNFNMIDIKNLS
jgi:hypothetical protein